MCSGLLVSRSSVGLGIGKEPNIESRTRSCGRKRKVMPKGNSPVAKFKIGFVQAAVWANDSGFHSVKLSRSYKDGDHIKDTDQLNAADLLNAAKVLERAEAWISDQ